MKNTHWIKSIIENESIITYFQPIISVKMKKIIGVEALSRGVEAQGIIPPDVLFNEAKANGLTIELDRLCRKKAIESFKALQQEHENLILFINIDASIIDMGVVGSGAILKAVRKFGVDPKNIAIEINELQVNDMLSLERFIKIHKSQGFMIALDDVGAGHSNLSRLTSVKPDIIKIDKSLVCNTDDDFYNKAVFLSLVNLSKKIGALVISEGIETENEAINALDFGVDMLQGYLFSKPMQYQELKFDAIHEKTENIAIEFKKYSIHRYKEEKQKREMYEGIAEQIAKDLVITDESTLEEKMEEALQKNPAIACIYILGLSGIQITNTIYDENVIINKSKMNSTIFARALKGTDHSSKSYYYMISEGGNDKYITTPYISLASGELCITVSFFFTDILNRKGIACIDLYID